MKRLNILTIALSFLCLSNANADGLNIWAIGEYNSIAGRVGYRFGEPNEPWEAGIASYWWPHEDAPQVYAIYGLYNFAETLTIDQPLNVDFLPDKIEAQPYIGAQVGVAFDNDQAICGPIAGLIIQDILVFEYQFQMVDDDLEKSLNDQHKVLLGLVIKLP